MKMDKVAGSGNDEFYTPNYAIEPLIKYVPNWAKIWCPFDTEDSNIVKRFRQVGNKVHATHISNGFDFFNLNNVDGDYIISNPPYSLKTQVFERLFHQRSPFAMLVGVVGIFESKGRFNLFKNNNFEIMYMSKRISYFKDFNDPKPSLNPPFSSVWICRDILPKQIVFEEIVK